MLTLILCAGRINYEQMPIATNRSNAMIPVAGKPVISWIIDDLLERGLADNLAIVVRAEDDTLINFVTGLYGSGPSVALIKRSARGTILESLASGLSDSPSTKDGVRLILGNGLTRGAFDRVEDSVCAVEIASFSRFCFVHEEAGKAVKFDDSKASNQIREGLALSGYYQFLDRDCLERSVKGQLECGGTQISDVLRAYSKVHPLSVRRVDKYFDFGQIENLALARIALLASRSFNSVSVDGVVGTLTKTSKHATKMRDELLWYESIPSSLKALVPRVLSTVDRGDEISVTQEFYGYPTLAELYVCSDIRVSTWRAILSRLLQIIERFREFPGRVSEADVARMYVGKTVERVDALRRIPAWQPLLEASEVSLGGRTLAGLPVLWENLLERCRALASSATSAIIHGDLCFSNILFDLHTQIIRLIDPRGSFGCPGIFGDSRYDLAKLRHSVCGHYDFIVTGLFTLVENSPVSYELKIHTTSSSERLPPVFDEILTAGGYDVSGIRFIEALLFLSMVPLHDEAPARQRALFLTGLRLLNQELLPDAECEAAIA